MSGDNDIKVGRDMRELSLFSGAGGGLLGTKLLGWRHVGYVERNEYCQKIIKQRIDDGIFDAAPIFSDIRSFISEGFAKSYQGMVDVISAGFPCQPFSQCGHGKAEKDDRNMWPETASCIRIIRPKVAWLENVPNLLAHKYIRRIFADLAEMGFSAKWGVLGSSEMGGGMRRPKTLDTRYSDRLHNAGKHGHFSIYPAWYGKIIQTATFKSSQRDASTR